MTKTDPLFISKPMTVAERTSSEAKLITEAETKRRTELTASLKAARLAKEAANAKSGKP